MGAAWRNISCSKTRRRSLRSGRGGEHLSVSAAKAHGRCRVWSSRCGRLPRGTSWALRSGGVAWVEVVAGTVLVTVLCLYSFGSSTRTCPIVGKSSYCSWHVKGPTTPSRGDDPQDRASKVGQFCKSAEEAIPPLALALFLFPLTTKAHSVRTLCMTRTEYRSEMTTLVQMGGCLLHTKVVLEATTIA
jgi:hypothetical protein